MWRHVSSPEVYSEQSAKGEVTVNKRKRISKEKVRENAEKGSQGGSDWFQLKEDVTRWSPEDAGKYAIDFVPYEVKSKNHPDDVEQGCLWYKLPFGVHHGVGANNFSVVCPQSAGKPCPICEEKTRLAKEDAEGNEEQIKQLSIQKFVAYNILNPEDVSTISLFIMSRGKFATKLEEELKDPDNEENLAFFDVNKDGRTLRVRFSEEKFNGKKFLQATKIDFRPREEMDEDEILDKVICLDEALIILPYDKLKSMFFQEMEEEEKPKSKSNEDEDEDEDDTDEDEDDDDEEEKPKSKSNEDEDEDEKPKSFKCKACGGTGKSSSGKVCLACNGTGKLKKDDDEDEDKDDDEEKPSSKKDKGKDGEKKSDHKCPVKGGKFGQVDQYDECDDCPYWNDCEEASE